MIKWTLRILHFFGGDELLLKIFIAAGSPFFSEIQIWPNDGPKAYVMLFSTNEFMRNSFLASWRKDDNEQGKK